MKKPSKLLIFWLASSPLLADPRLQDLNSLQQIAQAFVDDQLVQQGKLQTKAQVGQLDPRLQLPACDQPPEGFLPKSMQQSLRTIGVRCASPKSWSIYLPVQLQTFTQVLVSLRELNAGDRLSPADLELSVVDTNQLRGSSFQNADDISGAKVKRRIAQGQAINSKDLCYVCQGDSVNIVAGSASMQILMPGQALSDGFLGQSIRVRNLSSRKEVIGNIEATDRVVVP